MIWIQYIVEFIIGAGLLAWSAGKFIKGGSWVAQYYSVPPLIVGMVLLGFGTSCPELVVAIFAAAKNNPGIAIGSVIGSNISNIALVGGMAAILSPFAMKSSLLSREFPYLILVVVVVGVMFYIGHLTPIDGVILLILLIVYFYIMYRGVKGAPKNDSLLKETIDEIPSESMSAKVAVFWLVFGLAVLLVSAEVMVNAASSMASMLGLSDLVIGLTIVAIGTSLPELAATIASCLKKETDLAIGNVIGSCIFNLLAVLAMPALISPGRVPLSLLNRDYPVLLVVTVLFWLMAVLPPKRNQISRLSGWILFLSYFVYLAVIAWQALSA